MDFSKIKKRLVGKIPVKIQEEEKLADLGRFVAVLTVASVLLFYISSLNLEMSFSRRQVALQTNGILRTAGVNSEFYRHSITIPEDSKALPEASERFGNLGMTRVRKKGSYQFLADSLHPQRERILNQYVGNLREEGYRVYTSPSLIYVRNGESNFKSFQVDIIPECVGWIGLFAVIALIIAYPGATWRERFLGTILAVPLMHLMNLIRLTTTIYAGWSQGIAFLNIVHDFLWKTLLIFWALFLWIIWVKFIVKE